MGLAADAPIPRAKPDLVLQAFDKLEGSVERFTLGNGLRVVLAPSGASSTVGISVTYGVGSSAEATGRSGFAHLFEHMMFQGSRNAPKGQHFRLIAARGGSLNGTTDADRTNFYEELPASELSLGLWLEADRMRSLQVTEANFQNQRAVVEEEFRMRVQNQPYGPAELHLGELTFAGYAPYAHPVIGSLADLNAAKFDWVREFYEHFYGPNNAVLTVAGQFDASLVKDSIEQYFGKIPRRSAVEKPALPATAGRAKAAREVMTDRNAATPAIMLGFVIPPSRTREHYALDLLCDVLAGGESSRLYEVLVRQRAAAQEVSAWTEGHVGPDQLTVRVVLTDKGNLNDVEAAIDQELTRLGQEGPSLEELARAQQKQRTSAALGLQSNLSRAIRLGEFETEYGDARLLTAEVKHYLAIIPEDVKAAASSYLVPNQAVRIEVQPTSGSTQP
jgi:predicted Zn-dependent peptidase